MATGRKKTATKGKPAGRSGRGSSAVVVAARRGGPSAWTLVAIAVVVLLVGGLIAYFVTRPSTHATAPQGVQTFSNLSRNHVTGQVNYPQTPPVGGNHNSVWLNCGTYTNPVANENAVHSMEHGAVWITYQPTLPAADVTTLQHAVAGKSYVILSPYTGIPAPVVASAWGVQLRLTGAADPKLAQFINYYQQGPQTPEAGSPCSGGTGNPQQ